jgi:hypothetical protein
VTGVFSLICDGPAPRSATPPGEAQSNFVNRNFECSPDADRAPVNKNSSCTELSVCLDMHGNMVALAEMPAYSR